MLVVAEDRPNMLPDGVDPAGLLFGALREGVCVVDLDGRVVWHNPAFARLDDALRQRISLGCKRWATAAKHTGGATGAARPRFDATSADEQTIYEVLISPITGKTSSGQDGVTHLAAVVIDVTVPRRREHRMAAIDAAGTELVRLDVEQIKKMNMVERLGLLEQKVIRFAHDLLSFDHFAIRIIDRETEKLELVMSAGLPGAALAVELYARPEGNGISGYVAATGRSYVCADTTADARYVIGVDAARSSLTVPLRLSDKVIGIFNVESTQPGAFTEDDRQFAEMFATHIALALHMLNLLVAERSQVGQAVAGTMEGEITEPLADIARIVDKLKEAGLDDQASGQVERIVEDVESIRKRLRNVGQGAATVLGADDAVARAARSVDPILRGRRILVADDDQRIRQLVSEVLRARGAEVLVCEDGGSAVAMIEQLATGGPAGGPAVPGQERSVGAAPSTRAMRLDLLVSDIRLPDRTGYEIFTAARAVLPDLPVILMTGFGYDPHHSIVRASQAGLSAVLFKPFQAERLIEECHKALGAGA